MGSGTSTPFSSIRLNSSSTAFCFSGGKARGGMLGMVFCPEAYSGFSSTSISPTVQRPSLLLEKRARRRGVRISRMSSRRLLSSASSHASLSNRISARISSAVRSGSIGARGFSVRPASSRSK